MLKYDLKNNKAVVDQPSIWEIRNNKIIITSTSGKDYKDIPQEGYTIQVGNIEPIKIGATVSYGYNKNVIILENTTTSSKSDVTLCDPKNIVIQEYAGEDGWCKCTKGSNNKYLLYYQAMEENPSTEPRYAYFRHKTTVEGFLSEWYVTVMQKGKPEEGTSQNDPTNPYIPGNEPEVIIPGEDPDPVPTPEPTPTPNPEEPENPVITINVIITNLHGSTLTLDGRLRFVLGNPDHNGTYYGGYRGNYLRTDNIYFSNNQVTLEPGESKTFYGLSWRDADTGCGLGETSPLNPSILPILDDNGGVAYARNVLIYIDGRSDQILCDNLSNSIIFQNNETYNIAIR